MEMQHPFTIFVVIDLVIVMLQQSKPANSNENFAVKKESMKKILRGADIVATTLNSCVINIMETVFSPTKYADAVSVEVINFLVIINPKEI